VRTGRESATHTESAQVDVQTVDDRKKCSETVAQDTVQLWAFVMLVTDMELFRNIQLRCKLQSAK
jgi:hypothetical protein